MGRGGGEGALSDIPHGMGMRGEGTEKLSDSLPPEVVVVGGARDLCVEGRDRREE